MSSRLMRRALGGLAAGAAAALSAACVPYSVATTARPVPQDSSVTTVSFAVHPPFSTMDSARGRSLLAADGIVRRGVDSVSDVGLRLVAFSGLTVDYKRLLTRRDEPALIAVMPEVGLINAGEHALVGMTLLASSSAQPRHLVGGRPVGSALIPYGGIKVMQAIPLNADAVRDEAIAGGFVGVRIGGESMAVSPEIGVFYDRSALDLRKSTVVVVPSINVQGEQLLRALRGLGPLRRPY